jgi:AhpD family alkylhydroperoxidase
MGHSGERTTSPQQDPPREAFADILAPTTKTLLAIGAAAALNCHPCLNRLVSAALQNGVLEEEIKAAISLVGQIRWHAAGFTDKLVTDMLVQEGLEEDRRSEGC